MQLIVYWQQRQCKPFAQQRIGNALHTDAAIATIQREAVSVIIVAALMHQPPRPSVLPVVHDRHRLMLRFHCE